MSHIYLFKDSWLFLIVDVRNMGLSFLAIIEEVLPGVKCMVCLSKDYSIIMTILLFMTILVHLEINSSF